MSRSCYKPPEVIAKEAKDALRHEILMIRTDLGLRQYEIAEQMQINESGVSKLLSDLDKITAVRLRALIRMLHPNPLTVLAWLGYTDREIKAIGGGTK